MTVKIQHPMYFENKCGCLFDAELLSGAMIWFAQKPQCGKKTIFMHGRYPAVSIYGTKIHVHRLIGLFLLKNETLDHIHIHHKDHNRLNALPDNLENILDKVHVSSHNKGRQFSPTHRAKISEANRRRKGIKIKRMYDLPLNSLRQMLNEGWSISKIARFFGCGWDVVKNRIYENPELIK